MAPKARKTIKNISKSTKRPHAVEQPVRQKIQSFPVQKQPVLSEREYHLQREAQFRHTQSMRQPLRPVSQNEDTVSVESRPPQREARHAYGNPYIKKIVIGILSVTALFILFLVWPTSSATSKNANSAVTPPTAIPVTDDLEKKELLGSILAGLQKHILLPADETPTVMSITEPEKLIAKDPFFKNAEAGDTLIIFKNAGKALIYSSKRDIIVNVGPVQVAPEAENTAPQEVRN